jgi:hypothetical protein
MIVGAGARRLAAAASQSANGGEREPQPRLQSIVGMPHKKIQGFDKAAFRTAILRT